MAYARSITLLGWTGSEAREVIKQLGWEGLLTKAEQSTDNGVLKYETFTYKYPGAVNALTVGWLPWGLAAEKTTPGCLYLSICQMTTESCDDEDFDVEDMQCVDVVRAMADAEKIFQDHPVIPYARLITVTISDSK